jgi:hypothetical protein
MVSGFTKQTSFLTRFPGFWRGLLAENPYALFGCVRFSLPLFSGQFSKNYIALRIITVTI